MESDSAGGALLQDVPEFGGIRTRVNQMSARTAAQVFAIRLDSTIVSWTDGTPAFKSPSR